MPARGSRNGRRARPRGSSQVPPPGLGHTGPACAGPRGRTRRRRRCRHSALALPSRLRRSSTPSPAQMAPRSAVLLAAAALSAAMFAGADAQAFVPVRSAAALPLRARRTRAELRDCARLLVAKAWDASCCASAADASRRPASASAGGEHPPQGEPLPRCTAATPLARLLAASQLLAPRAHLCRCAASCSAAATRMLCCATARDARPRDDSRFSLRPRRSCLPAASRSCAAPRCRWRRRLRPR